MQTAIKTTVPEGVGYFSLPGTLKIIREFTDEDKIDRILFLVNREFRTTTAMLKTKSRKREIVGPRHIAMFFISRYTKLSLESVGSIFGHYDHSTVIHAKKTVNNLMDTDKRYRERIHMIEESIVW